MFPRYFARFKIKCILLSIFFIFLLDFFGVFTHMFELDYDRHFNYPLNGDVLRWAHQIRFHQEPEVQPINVYNFSYTKDCNGKCLDDETPVTPNLIIIVKSAIKNFYKRSAIRKTWGYEKRFSDIIIKTLFVLGKTTNRELQKHVEIESDQYKDIVQADFIDSYYNNTIKTMMGFKWAVTYCPRSRYFMFVDDDYYVSTKNVIRFIKNPINYPEYLEAADETLRKVARRLNQSDLRNISVNLQLLNDAKNALAAGLNSVEGKKHFHQLEEFFVKGPIAYERKKNKHKRSILDNKEITHDSKLFAGFVFESSPHRHKSSKWYITLSEYPFHKWPPYVTSGAFILSREALFEMYYTSMFTKHFKFDDIFLGIVALKADIKPLHSNQFYFHKALYTGPYSYRYVIASHGYNNPDEMVKIWTETRAAGHA